MKNFKKSYVAATAIIYFNEDDLNTFTHLHKSIRANTKFIKIGSELKNEFDKKYREKIEFNKFEENFFSWEDTKKQDSDEAIVLGAKKFYKINSSRLDNLFKPTDLVAIIYKDQNENVLEYVQYLMKILDKNNIFTFHLVVESFVKSKNAEKMYKKIKSDCVNKYGQFNIGINESNILQTYQFSNLINRKKYATKFINSIVESFIVPFVEPELNIDHYKKMKTLFYKNTNKWGGAGRIIPTIGFSDSKIDWIDKALIGALSNPIFLASFKASKDFLIILKSPYLTDKMIGRIEYIFKSIVGKDANVNICKYIGEFDMNIYAQINILALNVDETKITNENENIKNEISKILLNIENSKKLFDDEQTKTLLVDIPFQKINVD
ncbi:MAG: gliding machinery protein P42 [Metamycoplasmataceae bacterium]